MVDFMTSPFPPIVVGFFGLGTGYLIWGPQELFGWPPRGPEVDRAVGAWGIWLPGACQLVAGLLIFVGMTWFLVFPDPLLYTAAVAFTLYGIHWFVLGYNRLHGNDVRPNAGMAVAYFLLSVLGMVVFFSGSLWAVGVLFAGLTAVYLTDFLQSVGTPGGVKLHGVAHLATGVWLMYLMFAATLDISLGYSLPAG